MRKRHAIVQEWLDGGNDAGGCIAKLEAEIETLHEQVKEAERLLDEILKQSGDLTTINAAIKWLERRGS